jgi:hypothetical protein
MNATRHVGWTPSSVQAIFDGRVRSSYGKHSSMVNTHPLPGSLTGIEPDQSPGHFFKNVSLWMTKRSRSFIR